MYSYCPSIIYSDVFLRIFIINDVFFEQLDEYPHAAHAPLGVFIFVVCLLNVIIYGSKSHNYLISILFMTATRWYSEAERQRLGFKNGF